MKYNPLNRRMFLQGAGQSLMAIPFLQSLTERAHAQAVGQPPMRYVQFMIDHGVYDWAFWPQAQFLPATAQVGNVNSRPLSQIPGQLSHILNTDFNGAIRGKINLIRGLHGISEGGLHNSSMPTTGGQTINGGDDGQHTARFPYSVDYILSQSAKFYKTAPALRSLRMTPGVSAGYKWSSFSWGGYQNNQAVKLPGHQFNAAAFDEVFNLVNNNPTPMPSPQTQRRKAIVDIVLGDFNRLMNGPKIGSEDKALLSNFVDHVAELQRRIAAETPVATACTKPAKIDDANQPINHLQRHQNASDIAVAALACGVTNIAAINCYQGSETFYNEERFHDVAHRERAEFLNTEQVVHSDYQKWRLSRFADLIKKMDMFTESNGRTMLDNSLVYCGNEFAQSYHGFVNMPILTAGSAQGKIETGHYIDFKDRPLNSFLVSIFNIMGLAPADYERGGIVGFGEYLQANKTGINLAHIANDAVKRASLPFLVKV